jgi:hypothetical protein
MNPKFVTIALLAGLSLASTAKAVVTPVSWSFGSNPKGPFNSGAVYTSNTGGETIAVYGETVNGSGVLQGTSKLFSTNTTVFNNGTGIAPYNPKENGLSDHFSSQNGITPTNILELQLDSSIPLGTTLSFLLQGPTIDPIDHGPNAVIVYYKDAASPQSLTSMNVFDNSLAVPLGKNAISTTGLVPQFSIVKDTLGTEFIAIQSDCHYLLLDTITDTPAPAPEPRFYALLLIGLFGLGMVIVRHRRRTE